MFQGTAIMGVSSCHAKPGMLAPVGVRDILRGKCGRPTAGQRSRSAWLHTPRKSSTCFYARFKGIISLPELDASSAVAGSLGHLAQMLKNESRVELLQVSPQVRFSKSCC